MVRQRENRTLRRPTRRTRIPSHGNGLLVLLDVLEVSQRLLQVPAVDGLGGFARVLEADAQIAAAGSRGLGRFDGRASVADLL